MMKKDSRVSRLLGIEYPIISAPMSWVTDARLVAAVSEAGGLGLFGPNAGQTTVTTDPLEGKERMRREIAKARELTKKPIGAELMWAGSTISFAEGLADLYCEPDSVEVVLCLNDVPQVYINRLHAAGKICIHKDVIYDSASFKKAEDMGYDAIVVGGVDCGGHANRIKTGTFTAIPMARELTSLPLIAAGGIIDSKGVKAAGILGAEGIFVGTRFCASVESPIADSTKKKMCEMTIDDCLQVDGVFGPILALATPDIKKARKLMSEGEKNAMLVTETYAGGYRTGMLEGGFEQGIGLIDVSAAIGQIKEVLTVQQIFEEFAKGME